MNIRNIIMGVAVGSLILAAAAPAFAADWIEVGEGKYADKDSIRKLSNGWDLWIRVPAKKSMFRVHVNCDDASYTLIAGGFYTAQQADIETYRDAQAEAMAPGSFGYSLYEGLCTP